MKDTLIFYTSAIILTMFSCNTQEESIVPVADFDISEYEQMAIPQSKTIHLSKWDEDLQLVEEGHMQNGKRHGLWITYHVRGKQIPRSMATYVNGQLNGIEVGV